VDIYDQEKITPVKRTSYADLLKHWLMGSGSTEDQKEIKKRRMSVEGDEEYKD
jgi:hypothetical protein